MKRGAFEMRNVVIRDDVKNRFDIHIGLAELRNVEQGREGVVEKIENVKKEVEEEIRKKYTLEGLKDVKEIRKHRDFFWRMGIDPTKRRPAVEALLRRIVAGKPFPRILPIVDAYNLASVRSLQTFSAFDAIKVKNGLEIRFAEEGETVTLIGEREKKLSGKEILLTDSEKILCVYAYGDVEETKVTASTKDVLVVVYGYPGMEIRRLKEGLATATSLITEICGGELIWSEVF
ncbi:MAG: B3/B4 domain-containing protein [Candidatus Methanospirareceae archaeon]